MDLLLTGEYLDSARHKSIEADAEEVMKLLTSIIKSTKTKVWHENFQLSTIHRSPTERIRLLEAEVEDA